MVVMKEIVLIPIKKGNPMLLDWAIIFFILSLVAGYFGFYGLSADTAGIAKILFVVFLVLFIFSFISRLINRRNPRP
jgi:uncharacterized membrane protein YtjA (UPF0391 family)